MTALNQQLYIGARPSGELVVLDPQERRRHLYIVGQTGTGKSTLLLNLIRQDLVAGGGLALLDPHGDLAEAALADRGHADAQGRLCRRVFGSTSYEGLQAQVLRAMRNPGIKGVVFEVDSLGGELAGAFETADLIARLSAEKPTLAILTDHALSAGYLLASAARQIIVPEHGRAGSIGVPEEFGNWNSIFRQFRRWADSGVWDVILESLAGSGVCDAALQMIDATVIRAHHCAAGGKGGPSATRSAVRAAASFLSEQGVA